ncbi:transmembrane protein 60-like [Ctenocephalides felis]|uniref:transmembrane protein 60-like n=1 Tax=Ctenocephalides felis TaxID=7515 RepID=UPI000E6E21FD|nr:transmembrane protein 60-like [Ctenocephalides felis]XP_026469287.1 transmembrane protein 60-like [Ctenocephalides felis]
MAVLHRALFTWFILLVFLILLCLRLETRTHWNWFIVFIPMWCYDGILLIYVLFQMIQQCNACTERIRNSLSKNIWYMAAILLKMAAQITICLKLEYPKLNLPIYLVLSPLWILLPALIVDVFLFLVRGSNRY